MNATIVWFRQDLRIRDNPALSWALSRAAERSSPVIAVYILPPDSEEAPWSMGGATRWWLHHSLASLERSLTELGCSVVFRRGESESVLTTLIKESNADAVTWNRRYEPVAISRDAAIKERLQETGIIVESFNSALLVEPWRAVKADGTPYQVYTPFWKNFSAKGFGTEPLPIPKPIKSVSLSLSSDALAQFNLLPTISWDNGFSVWSPGEAGAHRRLDTLLNEIAADYADTRNIPSVEGTSRLSPHLHFGEISANEIVYAVRQKFPQNLPASVETYVKEIVWREFAYHLLFYFPNTPSEPLHSKYAKFPWSDSSEHLRAWQKGLTGYPIVDAGMRELWTTGWMHNRVRMIVSSFLVKHLLLPWQEGAKWFWDTLVDADLASNTMGWQWSAGCGADAAPYFRIFNPVLQGEKFDPEGIYVKRWCPELSKLGSKYIHCPWNASSAELAAAKITLGKEYPKPIVEHSEARARALEALSTLKSS